MTDDEFDTFTLNIEMGNAAMLTAENVAEALDTVAEVLRAGVTEHVILDENGNTVGKWELT